MAADHRLMFVPEAALLSPSLHGKLDITEFEENLHKWVSDNGIPRYPCIAEIHEHERT